MKKKRPTLRETRLKMLKRTREAQRNSKTPSSFDSLVKWLEGKVKPKKAKGSK
jgi:hypothetical protein